MVDKTNSLILNNNVNSQLPNIYLVPSFGKSNGCYNGCWDETTKQIIASKVVRDDDDSSITLHLDSVITRVPSAIDNTMYTVTCPVMMNVVDLPENPTISLNFTSSNPKLNGYMTTNLAITSNLQYYGPYELDFKSAKGIGDSQMHGILNSALGYLVLLLPTYKYFIKRYILINKILLYAKKRKRDVICTVCVMD